MRTDVAKYAQMWRITDDHWDVWMEKNKGSGSEFPFGLKEEFDRIAAWNRHVKPGRGRMPICCRWDR